MQRVTESDLNRPLKLNKTNVQEIDELELTIENLNAEVLDTASIFSHTFNLIQVLISAFEYLVDEDTVFCSKTFSDILSIE